jgi:hypothetical protein
MRFADPESLDRYFWTMEHLYHQCGTKMDFLNPGGTANMNWTCPSCTLTVIRTDFDGMTKAEQRRFVMAEDKDFEAPLDKLDTHVGVDRLSSTYMFIRPATQAEKFSYHMRGLVEAERRERAAQSQ